MSAPWSVELLTCANTFSALLVSNTSNVKATAYNKHKEIRVIVWPAI